MRLSDRNPNWWRAKGKLLAATDKTEEAVRAFTKSLELASGEDWETRAVAARSLSARGQAFGRLGKQAEAEADFRASRGLYRRSGDTPTHLLDLSAQYNAGTMDDWHNSADKGNNLASLPLGVHEFGGVQFDVRGIVQLSGTNLARIQPDYPVAVPGIQIGQGAKRLHFLHGTGWPLWDAAGKDVVVPIARYVIHYADGQTAELPIRYRDDVRNWQYEPEGVTREQGGASPVWKGPQARWKEHWPKWGVRLYLTTWTNPRPEVTIQSLDLISTMTGSAPFVLAITVDPTARDGTAK